MIKKIRTPILLMGLTVLLAACGNKGDLYIPDKEQPNTEKSSEK